MSYDVFIFMLIFAHFIGDYVFQSAWISEMKKTKFWPMIIHCFLYTGCIMFAIGRYTNWFSWNLFGSIFLSHWLIDNFRIRYEKKGYLFITPNRIFGKSDWLPTFVDQTLHFCVLILLMFKYC